MTHVGNGVFDPWDLTVNPLNWIYSEPKLLNELRHDILIDETVSLMPTFSGTAAGFRFTRYVWRCNVWLNDVISCISGFSSQYNGPWYGLAVTSDVNLFGINVIGKMRMRFTDM